MNTLQDRIRGSLIGGAIGDALGYPVEFMSLQAIKRKYGEKGIHRYQDFDHNGKAVVSDDSQMTLFTANGLLFGVTRLCAHGRLGAGLKDFVRMPIWTGSTLRQVSTITMPTTIAGFVTLWN